MYDPVSILLVASLAASLWLVWRTNKLFSKLGAIEMLVLVLAMKEQEREEAENDYG
jgi:hypothetical protein